MSFSLLTMHGGIWIQMRTTGVISERVKQWILWCGVAAMAAFAAAGIWVVIGIDGYAIVSQPPLDALPNPLAKTVEISPGDHRRQSNR